MTNSLQDDLSEFSRSQFAFDEPLNVQVTQPMKLAIMEVAARNGVSISDVVRRVLGNNLSKEFPEYDLLHQRFKEMVSGRKDIV